MQTSLQFDTMSSMQEWNSFKNMLQKGNDVKQGSSSSEQLMFHLSRQLEGGGILKESKLVIPMFSSNLRQAS